VVQDPALESEAQQMGAQAALHRPPERVEPAVQLKSQMPGGSATIANLARNSSPPFARVWRRVLQRMEEADSGEGASSSGPSSRASLRKRKEKPTNSPGSAEFIRSGFEKFTAASGSEGDGSQSTQASLYIGTKKYDGSTANGHGHAEMDGLYQFCQDKGEDAAATLARYKKKVSCTSKPCCVKCSAILGHLGFAPKGATKKIYHTMGGTEWAAHADVRKLIMKITGVSEDVITGMGSVAQKDLLPLKRKKDE
jgi:hypothetical protein